MTNQTVVLGGRRFDVPAEAADAATAAARRWGPVTERLNNGWCYINDRPGADRLEVLINQLASEQWGQSLSGRMTLWQDAHAKRFETLAVSHADLRADVDGDVAEVLDLLRWVGLCRAISVEWVFGIGAGVKWSATWTAPSDVWVFRHYEGPGYQSFNGHYRSAIELLTPPPGGMTDEELERSLACRVALRALVENRRSRQLRAGDDAELLVELAKVMRATITSDGQTATAAGDVGARP